MVGCDIVSAKVEGASLNARKLGLENVSFVQANFGVIQIPAADYFYLFNPVNEEIVMSLAEQIKLYQSYRLKPIKIIIYDGSWALSVFKKAGFKMVSSNFFYRTSKTQVLEYNE